MTRVAQRLIPKDLSEAIGKVPPSATDLEEAVLGALMLEVKSIEQVKFLKPAHFYQDKHSMIFSAIQQVVAEGAAPDMRMVRNKLRLMGQEEMVGGAYYIAELTSKVSSAANIASNARVIVEMSMKRDMIQLANRVHHEAYDDTIDVFELIQKFRQDVEFLEERETRSSGPERIAQLWEKLKITTKPERPETLIKLGDADVCTVGNISLLVGKKKARKSLLVTHLLKIFLQPREHLGDDIIVFDTEQEEYDVWMAKDRLYRMTNMHVPFFCLRGLSPKERRDFIEQTIIHWPGKKPKIAVIDGIRDCMSNINDPDESTEVMSWLMHMNVEYKTHFACILHLNKTDNNARGHIGTELLNKAEVTIEVYLDPQSKDLYPPSIVKCESSRRKPFEPFMFTHGPTGLPELLGAPAGADNSNDNDHIKKLEACFEGQSLKHSDLKDQVKTHFEIGDSKAKQAIAKWVRRGWILKSGPDRSPNTVYKLVASPGKFTPPPNVPDNPQQEIPLDMPPQHVPTDDLPF
jgi:hypothetical protein